MMSVRIMSNTTESNITEKIISSVIVMALIVFASGCVETPPKRDEIPHIKTQLSGLEKFYRGESQPPMDSLLTQRFFAEIGRRGQWEAITVAGEVWPFDGFANRSFFYTNEIAEVDLHFRYKHPSAEADSLVQAKIHLKHIGENWLVEDVVTVEPIIQ